MTPAALISLACLSAAALATGGCATYMPMFDDVPYGDNCAFYDAFWWSGIGAAGAFGAYDAYGHGHARRDDRPRAGNPGHGHGSPNPGGGHEGPHPGGWGGGGSRGSSGGGSRSGGSSGGGRGNSSSAGESGRR